MDDRAPAERPRPEPRVERARPADRGLVARLLEAVVAEDPAVAPEVAAGSLRAAQWLQRARTDWQGVAVLDADGVRSVVGYVAVSAASGPGRLLVHPAYRRTDLEARLLASARAALAEAPAPAPVVVEPETEPELVRVAPARTTWRQRVTEPVGAVAIVAAGLVAVLAVQVGTGPLADVVPFLGRDRDASSGSDVRADQDPTLSPSLVSPSAEPAAAAPVPGVVLTPAPATPAPGTPGSGPTPAPSGPAAPSPTPTPAPTDPPRQASGPTSALLDPVVQEVVEVLDGVTGNAAAPVTGAVRDVLDLTTDVLDDVIGLLVPPRP